MEITKKLQIYNQYHMSKNPLWCFEGGQSLRLREELHCTCVSSGCMCVIHQRVECVKLNRQSPLDAPTMANPKWWEESRDDNQAIFGATLPSPAAASLDEHGNISRGKKLFSLCCASAHNVVLKPPLWEAIPFLSSEPQLAIIPRLKHKL